MFKKIGLQNQLMKQKQFSWISYTLMMLNYGLILHFDLKLTLSGMLTTIFRLGPFVLLEVGFVASSFILWMFEEKSSCYYYTLGYLSVITFLVEMITSLRMMKDQNSLRGEFLCQRVKESNSRYYCRLVWDNLNISLVIMLLYYSLIVDGLNLSSISDSSSSPENPDCQYTMFCLCLFQEFQKALQSSTWNNMMVMWLLYAAGTFLTSLICIIFSWEYYQYCSSMASNRRMHQHFGTINQTLLDCKIFSLSSNAIISEQVRQQIGVCSICLHPIVGFDNGHSKETIVRLRCQHIFHKECIDEWLRVKDHCPFRCSGRE